MTNDTLLSVKDLKVYFPAGDRIARAVDGVSFEVRPEETVCIVGESGCGKTVSALSILGLNAAPPAEIAGGRIMFDGQSLLKLDEESMRKIRGNHIAMVFQEPLTSLNPVFTIGDQISEAVSIHKNIGGQRQRVMIAMALACAPRLIIADEPTTALDVTVQAQILQLFKSVQKKHSMSLLYITHDLGVVANIADRVYVMYAGAIVEQGNTAQIFRHACHPYTQGLLASLPSRLKRGKKLYSIPGAVPNPAFKPQGCSFHPR